MDWHIGQARRLPAALCGFDVGATQLAAAAQEMVRRAEERAHADRPASRHTGRGRHQSHAFAPTAGPDRRPFRH